MSDNVEVKIGADTSGAKADVKDASASIAASLEKISTALQSFGAKNAETAAKAKEANAELSLSFTKMRENVAHSFEGVTGAIEKFHTVMIGLGAVLAGGILWRESVGEMLHMEDEVRKLENVMGMLSDQATQTALALKIIGSSSDAYAGIALKMGRVLKGNQDEFTRLGVTIKDAQGNLLPMETIMQNSFATLQQYKAGTDQAEVALTLFGRGASEVYDIMSRLPAAQERAAQLAKELNIEWGPEKQQRIEAYRMEVGAFKVVLGEVEEKIGEAVLPQLEALAKWFNSEGPGAAEVIVKAIKGILAVFSTIGAAAKMVGAQVSAFFDIVILRAQEASEILALKWNAGWKANVEIFNRYAGQIEARQRQMNKEILDANDALGAALGGLFDKSEKKEKPGPGPLGHGPKTFTPKPSGSGQEESVMAYLENNLKAQEDAYNHLKLDQGSFETWSIESTRNYWNNLRSSTLLSTKDRLAVTNKYYDAERQVQQKAFAEEIAAMETKRVALKFDLNAQLVLVEEEQRKEAERYGAKSVQAQEAERRVLAVKEQIVQREQQLAAISDKIEEASANHAIAMEQMALDQGVALRRVSVEQQLAEESSLQDKLYSIKLAGYQRQLVLERDPVKIAALNEKIEELELTHQEKLTEIANRAELERQRDAIAAADAVQSSFGTLINDLISHTKSLKDIWKDFTKNLTSQLNGIASNAIAKQLFGAGTGGGDALNNIFGKIFGGKQVIGGADPTAAALTTSATSLTTAGTALDTAATTISTAQTAAATALSSAAAALSSAAASMSAGGLGGGGGGGGGFDSLFGGGDSGGLGLFDAVAGYAVGTPYVPQDSLAMVHKGEAIIPAKYNNGGLGGGFNNVNQFNITAPLDTRTQHQIMRSAAEGVRRASLRG